MLRDVSATTRTRLTAEPHAPAEDDGAGADATALREHRAGVDEGLGREPAVVEELEELSATRQRTVTHADNRRIDLSGARQRPDVRVGAEDPRPRCARAVGESGHGPSRLARQLRDRTTMPTRPQDQQPVAHRSGGREVGTHRGWRAVGTAWLRPAKTRCLIVAGAVRSEHTVG